MNKTEFYQGANSSKNSASPGQTVQNTPKTVQNTPKSTQRPPDMPQNKKPNPSPCLPPNSGGLPKEKNGNNGTNNKNGGENGLQKLLEKFLPPAIYNPKTKKIFGMLTAEDLLIAALVLIFLESDEEESGLLVLALLYLLISEKVDLSGLL